MSGGAYLKRQGMSAAERAANDHWMACMAICVYQIAKEQPYLTTDPVFERLKELFPNAHTHNHRAAGPVMTNAAKAGWIAPTSLPHVKTNRATNHQRPLAVWKSLIYGRADLPDPPDLSPYVVGGPEIGGPSNVYAQAPQRR